MDWSVVCPACDGPGRILRDWLGDAEIVCDSYVECSGGPSLDEEIAFFEKVAAGLAGAAENTEDADMAATMRQAAADESRRAGALLVAREAQVAEWAERLNAWRAMANA